MNDQIISPPNLPNTDQPPEFNAPRDEWHYVHNGVRKGPVSVTAVQDLLRKRQIETDTQVWRKGMPEWKCIRESDLAALVADEPPSVSPQQIGNGCVWTLAFLPLLWGIIDASIIAHNQEAAARSMAFGFPYDPSGGLPWQIPMAANTILGLLDERRLAKAGYGSNWMRAAAIFIIPVYLFVRAKRLRQSPWYAICWILTMLTGIVFAASAGS